MWNDLKNGREFPDNISRDEYYEIKSNKDEDKGLAGFVGFCCSFAGKWWGGYASDSKGNNYCLIGKRSLQKVIPNLTSCDFVCKDYTELLNKSHCVYYCDPPYENTTGYGGKFDSNKFWDNMRELSKNNLVFVSELKAPDDFVEIWDKDISRTTDINKNNQFKSTEKLFVHKCNVDIVKGVLNE